MICDRNKCTGCSACYNICPKNAIQMKEDVFGNIYPYIDEKKCIKCNLCEKVCPQLNNINFKKSITAYAMHIKNPEKRSQSASGGAATLFYETVLEQKGVVYGASNLFGNDSFEFIKIEKKEDLYKVKGSKYVHCYINNVFKDIKNELQLKKQVLFIGTPCQVSGLKSFLMKKYDNLICIDLICHGVPSQKLLFDELDSLNINREIIKYISFRDDKKFNFKVIDLNNNVLLNKPSKEISYYNNFLEGNIYRDNCYSCRYARKERISDITIGDFWGLNKNSIVFDDENKGISLVIVNTEKGEMLVDKIKEYSIIEERSLDEAYKENGQLNHPIKKTKKNTIYKKYYPKIGYIKTSKKMISSKDIIKKVIKNSIIYNTIFKSK